MHWKIRLNPFHLPSEQGTRRKQGISQSHRKGLNPFHLPSEQGTKKDDHRFPGVVLQWSQSLSSPVGAGNFSEREVAEMGEKKMSQSLSSPVGAGNEAMTTHLQKEVVSQSL